MAGVPWPVLALLLGLGRGMSTGCGSDWRAAGTVDTWHRAAAVGSRYTRQLREASRAPHPAPAAAASPLHRCTALHLHARGQVGDIGLMGAPAKLNGKAVEGFKIFTGGKIGEHPALATEFETGVPATMEHLVGAWPGSPAPACSKTACIQARADGSQCLQGQSCLDYQRARAVTNHGQAPNPKLTPPPRVPLPACLPAQVPKLKEILVSQFGAKERAGVAAA